MKENKRRRDATLPLIVTSAMLFIFLVCTVVIFAFTYSELEKTRNDYESPSDVNAAQKSDSELASENARLGRQLLIAEQTRSELENKISELENELEARRGELEADDDTLNGMIAALRKELDIKKAEIESLKHDIRMNARENALDLNAVDEAFSALSRRVSVIPESIMIRTPVLRRDEGVPVVDEKGEAIYDIVESAPRIALFYCDLTRGYRYSFGDDIVFSSPEMDMLLLAYQIVTAKIAEDNRVALDLLSSAEAAHNEREFNFDELIPCVPETENVKKREDGKYSVSEVISMMLEFGDAGAYAALTEKYGETRILSAASSSGLDVINGNVCFTASQAGRFAAKVYDLIEGESDTSEKMKEAMSDSVHSALTAYSVSPKKAAHICLKNGCYGDVAFVFDDNPYVIVILSDMEPGEQENSYLCSVIELVDKLHDTLGK
ncbi:MAG: hypothetical protein IJU75_05605 [Clostridia bacterium]|nr:hypothetical protein [Clostridia bacterium]